MPCFQDYQFSYHKQLILNPNMTAIDQFTNAIQGQCCSVLAYYFDRCESSVFEKDSNVKIDVRCSSALDLSPYQRKPVRVGSADTEDRQESAKPEPRANATSTIDTRPAFLHRQPLRPYTIDLNLDVVTLFLRVCT